MGSLGTRCLARNFGGCQHYAPRFSNLGKKLARFSAMWTHGMSHIMDMLSYGLAGLLTFKQPRRSSAFDSLMAASAEMMDAC